MSKYSSAGRPKAKKIPCGLVAPDGVFNHKVSKKSRSRINVATGKRIKGPIKLI